MPQYTVKHKESGKTITFNWTGENPPTEQDLQQVYSEALKPKEKTWTQWGWEQAPMVGMTLGGLLSRGGGVPGLMRRAGMAGAGGELGELIKQTAGYGEFPPGSPEASAERAKMGMLGMGSELAMPPVIGAIKKTVGPFAGRITEEGKRLLQLAKEWKLPIPPSQIAPSFPARAIEAVINFTPLVNRVVRLYQNRIKNNLFNVAKEMSENYSDEAIETIQKGLNEEYKQAFRLIKEPKIKIINFINALEKAYPNMSKDAKNTVNAIKIEMGNSDYVSRETASNFKKMIGTLGGTGKKSWDLKRAFNDALKEDIARTEGGEFVIGSLKQADESYRLATTNKEVNKLFNRSFEFLKDDPIEKFNVGKYESAYIGKKGARKKLVNILGEESSLVKSLDDLLLVSRAAKKDISRIGPKNISTEEILMSGGAGAGMFHGGAGLLAPVGLLGGIGTARSYMAQRGLLRKFLTEGFKFPESMAFKEPLKLGGRYAIKSREE